MEIRDERTAPSAREKIVRYLKSSRGKMFCDSCIKFKTGILYTDLVERVAKMLVASGPYQRGTGTCAICKRATIVTLQTRRDESQSPPTS